MVTAKSKRLVPEGVTPTSSTSGKNVAASGLELAGGVVLSSDVLFEVLGDEHPVTAQATASASAARAVVRVRAGEIMV